MLTHFLPGETEVADVGQELSDQDEMLKQLKYYLLRAQQSMTKYANARSRDVSFQVGYMVVFENKAT